MAVERICARESCGKACEFNRWYCSEECSALAFAEKYGLPATAKWATERIEAASTAAAEASARMKAMHAKLTPEERSARAARAREARTVREAKS